MTTQCLVLTRAVHFGACLLFFGLFGFDQLVAVVAVPRGPAAIATYWAQCIRWLGALSLVLILLSGLVWFALVAMTMSGEPLSLDILKVVWTQTQFGTVAKIRVVFWFLALSGTLGLLLIKSSSVWLKKLIGFNLVVSGLLLGSLAWAGHGTEGQPAAGHLLADVLHLLVAGLWPTGLLPFALVLRQLRHSAEPGRWDAVANLLHRFSALSLFSVAELTVTGFINSWYLVGSWANLFGQPYGRWLIFKIILFGTAVSIGAVNLLRLKPRLLDENSTAAAAQANAARLQFNVWLEVSLGVLIVLVVAILGLQPPAVG
jgi:putative copper resistance protein D